MERLKLTFEDAEITRELSNYTKIEIDGQLIPFYTVYTILSEALKGNYITLKKDLTWASVEPGVVKKGLDRPAVHPEETYFPGLVEGGIAPK